MADQDPIPTQRGEHPVLVGLIALAGVAIVVGLIVGGGALVASKVLGLDGDDTATDGATSGDSMYLPWPQKTTASAAPTTPPSDTGTSEPGGKKSESQKPEREISLSAGQTAVGQMEQIDLSGVYPGGEGAILQVQRFEGGRWADFPVTASVSNETFSTYILTSQVGVNRFLVLDTVNQETSNEIRVRVS